MKQMKILCITDGIPGHESVSLGVIQRLKEAGTQVDVTTLTLERNVAFLARLSELAANLRCRKILNWLLTRMHGSTLADAMKVEADLVLSTGGKTRCLNAGLALAGRKTLFCGTTRRMNPEVYGRVLTVLPVGARNNILSPVMPNKISRQVLAEVELPRALKLDPDRPVCAILIGGDGAGFRYGQDDAQTLAAELLRLHQQSAAQFCVLTSRRTPESFVDALKAALPGDIVVSGPGAEAGELLNYQQTLAAASHIVCTADSMTMVMESVSSGKPVYLFTPSVAQPSADYSQVMEGLRQAGLVKSVADFDAADVGRDGAADAVDAWVAELLAYLAE